MNITPAEASVFGSLLTTAGGICGWFANHWFSKSRELDKSKAELHRKIGELRSKVERQSGSGLLQLYHHWVPVIQGDVAALKAHMCCGHSKRLRAAHAFASIPHNEIHKHVGPENLGVEFESGRKRILDAIDALEKSI